MANPPSINGNSGPVGGVINATMTAGLYNAIGRNCALLGWNPGLGSTNPNFGVGGYAGTPGSAATINYVTAVEGQAYNGGTTIGLSGLARLDAAITGTGGIMFGVQGKASSNKSRSTGLMVGVYGSATPEPTFTWGTSIGGDFLANGPSTVAIGGRGSATVGTTKYGLYGQASGSSGTNYGVYGKAPMLQTVPVTNWVTVTSWAGYFDGHVQVVGSFTSGSDRKLKKDISPLLGATEIIKRLSPKRNYFDRDAHPNMELPSTEQFGLIAQEVAQVAPNLVQTASHPAKYRDDGSQEYQAEDYLSLNYIGLIPVLVGAVNEQQAIIEDKQSQIDALEDRMDRLEELLLGEAGKGRMNPGSSTQELQSLSLSPNPFNDRTTIRYSVDCPCRVRLEVTTTDGKPIATVLDERREPGVYDHEWNTEHIAQGVYICTLVVDGKPTVKQAVKVSR